MSKVIETDAFKRATAINTFKKLTGILEKHNQKLLADPIKYFKEASRVICEHRATIDDIRTAAFRNCIVKFYEPDQVATYEPMKTVVVTLEDYECLQAVRELLK